MPRNQGNRNLLRTSLNGPMKSAEACMLMIELARALGTGLLRTSDRFGTRAEDLLVLCGLCVGQAEGRPMTANKLSAFVGQARPSVIRRLNALEAAGLVRRVDRGAFVLADGLMDTPAFKRAMREVERRVRRAGGS